MNSRKIWTTKTIKAVHKKRLEEWLKNNERVKRSYKTRGELKFTLAQLWQATINK